jgi:hypothetical protein
MAVYGYILIEGEKWLVSTRFGKTRRSVKRRGRGGDGEHMEDIQVFLEAWDNRWLLDHLRYGDRVYLPLELSDTPAPPAANGRFREHE